MRSRTRFAVAMAMIALAGCTWARSAPLVQFPHPTEPASLTGSDAPVYVTDVPLVIHVVNHTAQVYRVSIAFRTSAQVLGSVPALESRDFVVARRNVLAYREMHLVAAWRDGAGRRDSEEFPVQNVSTVDWTLDSTPIRSVKLR